MKKIPVCIHTWIEPQGEQYLYPPEVSADEILAFNNALASHIDNPILLAHQVEQIQEGHISYPWQDGMRHAYWIVCPGGVEKHGRAFNIVKLAFFSQEIRSERSAEIREKLLAVPVTSDSSQLYLEWTADPVWIEVPPPVNVDFDHPSPVHVLLNKLSWVGIVGGLLVLAVWYVWNSGEEATKSPHNPPPNKADASPDKTSIDAPTDKMHDNPPPTQLPKKEDESFEKVLKVTLDKIVKAVNNADSKAPLLFKDFIQKLKTEFKNIQQELKEEKFNNYVKSLLEDKEFENFVSNVADPQLGKDLPVQLLTSLANKNWEKICDAYVLCWFKRQTKSSLSNSDTESQFQNMQEKVKQKLNEQKQIEQLLKRCSEIKGYLESAGRKQYKDEIDAAIKNIADSKELINEQIKEICKQRFQAIGNEYQTWKASFTSWKKQWIQDSSAIKYPQANFASWLDDANFLKQYDDNGYPKFEPILQKLQNCQDRMSCDLQVQICIPGISNTTSKIDIFISQIDQRTIKFSKSESSTTGSGEQQETEIIRIRFVDCSYKQNNDSGQNNDSVLVIIPGNRDMGMRIMSGSDIEGMRIDIPRILLAFEDGDSDAILKIPLEKVPNIQPTYKHKKINITTKKP